MSVSDQIPSAGTGKKQKVFLLESNKLWFPFLDGYQAALET